MRSPLLMFGALAAVGCGFNAAPDGPDAEATSSSTTAIVVVERTSGPGDIVRGDAVVARFVRVRGSVDAKENEASLRLAGVAQELPPVGSCATSFESPEPSGVRRSIDLLDVGSVSIDGKELGQRVMPDAAGIVSGVFYSKTANDTFVPGARLTLRASGGKDLSDPFVASIASPREVNDVRVVPAPGALEVAWDASDASPLDRVYVDVLGPSSRLLLRCTAVDAAGHTVLPTLAEEGTVAVHRVHVEPFSSRGLDRAEVRFDVARLASFKR